MSTNNSLKDVAQKSNVDLSLLLSGCLIAFIVFACLLIYAITVLVKSKKASDEGLLIIKINTKQKWAMRLTPISLSSCLTFDTGADTMLPNKFYKINWFLSHFDSVTRVELENILQKMPDSKRYSVKGYLNHELTKNTINNLTLKNFGIKIDEIPLRIKISGDSDNNYYVSISWRILKEVDTKTALNLNICNIEQLIGLNQNNLISFALIPNINLFQKGPSKLQWIKICNLLKIRASKTELIHYEGVLYFVNAKTNSHSFDRRAKKFNKVVASIVKDLKFNGLVDYAAVVASKKINNNKELENFIYKAKFLLHNQMNTDRDKSYLSWNIDDSRDQELEEFKVKIKDYESKISTASFIKEVSQVLNVSNNKKTSLQVIYGKMAGVNNDDINFYNKFLYYSMLYTFSANKYLIDASETGTSLLLHTTDLVLSENLDKLARAYTLFILHPHSNSFDLNIIDNILKKIPKKTMKIGLYIEEITPKLLNYIETGTIHNFVISSSLSQKFATNIETYLKLLNLTKTTAQIENTRVLWENLPENTQQYHKDKLKIKYSYVNKYIS
ncbi:hypothetical protein KQ874_00045 [Mycoplasma sp. ES3157-GEN-MYC]|uniref:Uncharacterized protein n=1 Tax=Mycoplasma miroungigenitalium TaxID=754515 RepID=A0A6M4JAU0_9MOLU|nr:hypothetical protein [Mycoplasma miroungigenitalium]MBU4690099.1 hypothetical protein [Mycoplasma miroungigenitalium]MBU4691371.1 hypothetical protein [Mycoplasma miroungigenitalium]QJR43207.1 hypothetical protein HLA87_00050 [Mycoplasma miroungigenitalium]